MGQQFNIMQFMCKLFNEAEFMVFFSSQTKFCNSTGIPQYSALHLALFHYSTLA
jgi:hypothetical protein